MVGGITARKLKRTKNDEDIESSSISKEEPQLSGLHILKARPLWVLIQKLTKSKYLIIQYRKKFISNKFQYLSKEYKKKK